jgi:S-layer protein
MAFPTNANQVQAFAGAMYGIQIGSVTMAQVNNDIANSGGLTNALNSYYNASFGGVATSTVAATVAANLGLTGAALSEGTNYVTARLNAVAANARGEVIADILNLFKGLASDATFGAAATAWNTKVDAAAVYTAATDVAIGTVVTTNGAFTLTTSVDTLTGTAGNDSFSGVIDSWTALDAINGGAGTDTFIVATTATVAPTGATVTNVENLVVSTTGAGYAITTTGFTGLTSVTVSDATAGTVAVTSAATTAATISATGNGPVTVVGTGGALNVVAGTGQVDVGQTAVANALTSVTVSGGTAVNITDRSGTAAATGSTLTTVSVSNATAGAIALTGNGITTLNLTAQTADAADVTITAAAATRALTVNLTGVVSAANQIVVTDATATTVNVNAVTTASSAVNIVNAAATTVNINSGVALTVAALTAGVATAVNISGAARTTITADTLAAAAVVTSTSTGGVTLTQELLAGQQFVGAASTGADVIGVANTATTAITTGDGNDTISYGGVLGTGGSVNAGGGTGDIIVMSGAEADAADASAVFNSRWTGFEVLSIETGANVTLDMLGLGAISQFRTLGSTLVLNNVANGGTVTLTAANTAFTANVPAAPFSTGDTFNIALSNAAASAFGTVTLPGIETVAITAADATTAGGTAVIHTLTLAATSATNVTVAGNNGLNMTNTGNVAVTTFDASGVVANGTADTAALLAVTYLSANTTGTASVSITGGAGADKLAGNAANIDSIVGGAGTDNIIGDASAEVQTITLVGTVGAGALAGTGTYTILGTAVTVTEAAAATATGRADAAVLAINADATIGATGRVVAANVGGVITLTYAATEGNATFATYTTTSRVSTGPDVLTTGTNAQTADGALNTKADILNGGAGSDVFHYGAGAGNTTVNVDTIIGLDLGGAATSTDTFVFANAGATKTIVTLSAAQQSVVTAASTFANAVDNAFVAIAADGATGTFTYAGDTYLLHNGDGGATYTAAADYVIKITGFVGTLDTGDFSVN